MLLKDLPAFCRAVRWNSITAPSAGTIFIKGRNDPVHLTRTYAYQTVKRHFQLSIRLQSTHYVRLCSELQEQLARPIRELRIAGMKVLESVTGGQPTMRQDLLKSIQDYAGNQCIFLTALAWDMIDIIQEMILTAQELSSACDYGRAVDHYWSIISTCQQSLLFASPDLIYDSDADEPAVLLARMFLDAAAAYGLLKIRLGDHPAVQYTDNQCHSLSRFISQFENRDSILGYAGQPQATWLVDSLACQLELLLQLEQAFTSNGRHEMRFVEENLEEASQFRPSSAHISHDRQLVKDLLGNPQACSPSSPEACN
jgi:hypothetical protein